MLLCLPIMKDLSPHDAATPNKSRHQTHDDTIRKPLALLLNHHEEPLMELHQQYKQNKQKGPHGISPVQTYLNVVDNNNHQPKIY